MTSVETYIVAMLMVCLAGFSCGVGISSMERQNRIDIESPIIVGLAGVACVALAFGYAVAWGLIVDGPHLVALPALIGWLALLAYGKHFGNTSGLKKPFLISIGGTALVIAGYYLLKPFTVQA